MSDIVKRLRAPAYWFSGSSEGHEGENSAPLDAASTIERLRVELTRINMENDRLTRTNRAKREHRNKLLHEITRLRETLLKLTDHFNHGHEWSGQTRGETIQAVEKFARAALGGENER